MVVEWRQLPKATLGNRGNARFVRTFQLQRTGWKIGLLKGDVRTRDFPHPDFIYGNHSAQVLDMNAGRRWMEINEDSTVHPR